MKLLHRPRKTALQEFLDSPVAITAALILPAPAAGEGTEREFTPVGPWAVADGEVAS